ncbi:MAG: SusC/RagA family TonB-linked outer membrane protein [Bacteroidia bacterium]|nr:SusC/RagA family TonB-linked outer membrane protein [Bacteroidia bacterium]
MVVTGRVTSSREGEPLSGATVLVKNTTTGGFTDDDGRYSIEVPNGEAVLVFSYLGHDRLEVAVGGRRQIDVVMAAQESSIEEIVVTGYTTQRSKEVTSAITSVKAEDFNRGLVNDPAQLVQGKVAGLSIARAGSDPNAGFAIRLRGLSTLGQNEQPLVIIDGVPNASLQTVDPNDIQSIDVLKDGSAAAIYGTQAASGVIIITTKKGLPGTSTVEYSGQVTVDQIAKRVPVMDATEFLATAGANRADVDFGSNTDWVDEITRNGVSTVHNLSLSGGTRSTSYRIAVNWRSAQGILLNSGFSQLNGRINLTQKALNDRLTISVNLASTSRESQFGMRDALRYAVFYNPTAPVYFPENSTSPIRDKYDGFFQAEGFDYFNPVSIVMQNENDGKLTDLLGSLRGELEIIDGLKLAAFYSQQRETDVFSRYSQKRSYYGGGFNRNGLARQATDTRINEQFDATLNYTRDFESLNLDVLAGYSYQDFTFTGFGAEGGDFLSDALSYNNLGAGRDFLEGLGSVFSYKSTAALISFFGSARVNIKDTYFLMASLRNDGSSRFGANNKRANFYGVSAGVNLANLVSLPNVDELKLRAGYGTSGNLPRDSYLSILLFGPSSNFFYNGEFVPAFAPTRNANRDLRWERKGEFNVGADFSLFSNKLFGTIDYYTRTTTDLIYEVQVPVPPNQASRTQANLEDVALRNSGIEVSIGARLGNDALQWEPRVVFATYKTILDSLSDIQNPEFRFFKSGGQFLDFSTSPGAPGQNDNPTIRVAAGEEIGQIWGPRFIEIGDDGNFVLEDLDGDGIVLDANGLPDADDKQIIGWGLPDFSLGFNNSLTFGDFDLNFFLRGDFGHDLANMYRNFYESLGNRVSRKQDNTVKTEYYDEGLTAKPVFNSFYVEDASYVVLDNGALGYNFTLGGEKGAKARVFVAGQNLFMITNYSGVDPSPRYSDPGEADNGALPPLGNNVLAPGLDRRSTYYRARSFTLGVNLTF